jgi:uncharacterized protein (DUF1697 family)
VGCGRAKLTILLDHELEQVDAAVAVAPFVVVPAHQLEEALVETYTAAGIEDARVRVVDKVARDDFIARMGENAFQVAFARPLLAAEISS